jgi:drug/metabolite transporter (DMT)-like permease
VHRPSRADLPTLALGVLGVGTSGPLIAATRAPSLAIALWRNVIGTAVLAPYALLRHRAEFRALERRQWLTALASGLCLGLHFSTWTPSLTMTSVASATAFAATQPIFAAFIARLRGEHVARRAWLGIVVAVLGVVALSGVDLHVSLHAFVGDLSALAAAVFAAVYVTLGSKVRQTVSLTPYATVCYGTASLTLAAMAGLFGQHLLGFGGDAWLKILALTAGAQLMGHTMFNRALKTTSATVVSVVILLEVPIAAVIAAVWLGQVPSLWALPGALLILVGLVAISAAGAAGASADDPAVAEPAVAEPASAEPLAAEADAADAADVADAAEAPASGAPPAPRASGAHHETRTTTGG